MKCRAAGQSRESFERELRDMVIEDAAGVGHSLYCQVCQTRDIALQVLDLVGWSEEQFLDAVIRHAE